jgi:hypothetical protein
MTSKEKPFGDSSPTACIRNKNDDYKKSVSLIGAKTCP